MCVWGGAKSVLENAGFDVVWTGDWESDPGDEAILEYAVREGRVLVTLDKDLGEWVFLHRRAHCGIVRLVGFRGHEQGEVWLLILRRYQEALRKGAIEIGTVRVQYAERVTVVSIRFAKESVRYSPPVNPTGIAPLYLVA